MRDHTLYQAVLTECRWPVRFEIGDRLPTLPLILSWETSIPVDLEAAYVDACKRRRLL